MTPTPTPTQVANEVDARDNFFVPASITVPVGTTVTWTNIGLELHTVTSDTSGIFNRGIGPGQSFSFTFTEPGTYNYHCIPHEADDMVGEVIVE
jgi:plastocyanin